MLRQIGTFVAVIRAALMFGVFGLVLLVILAVTAPIFQAVAVAGPAGTTKDVIQFGSSHLLLTVGGMLSIPAAVALLLFTGGDGSNKRPPRRRRFN